MRVVFTPPIALRDLCATPGATALRRESPDTVTFQGDGAPLPHSFTARRLSDGIVVVRVGDQRQNGGAA